MLVFFRVFFSDEGVFCFFFLFFFFFFFFFFFVFLPSPLLSDCVSVLSEPEPSVLEPVLDSVSDAAVCLFLFFFRSRAAGWRRL